MIVVENGLMSAAGPVDVSTRLVDATNANTGDVRWSDFQAATLHRRRGSVHNVFVRLATNTLANASTRGR